MGGCDGYGDCGDGMMVLIIVAIDMARYRTIASSMALASVCWMMAAVGIDAVRSTTMMECAC